MAKEFMVLSDDGVSAIKLIELESGKNGKNFILWAITVVGKSGCINDNGEINLLFRDGTRESVVSDSKFNCTGDAQIVFGILWKNHNSLLEELTHKQLESIRVNLTSGVIDEDFTNQQSADLMQIFNCLKDKM
jgi:hypothetical protein